MIIKIANKEIEFDIVKQKPREVIDIISKELDGLDMVLSHIVADGVEIRNELVSYLEKNINEIEVVEGFGMDKIMLPIENAGIIKEAIDGILPVMDVLAEDFRLGVSERGWMEFKNVIDIILFVDKATKRVFSMFIDAGVGAATSSWDLIRNEYLKMDPILKKLQRAVDSDENAVAGDIIQNEIKPKLEKTSYMIGEMILKPAEVKKGEKLQ